MPKSPRTAPTTSCLEPDRCCSVCGRILAPRRGHSGCPIGLYCRGGPFGLLMSYGQDFPDYFRCAAAYVDKILKRAKPADLPVEQPTKFNLLLNLKTAKALGPTMPQTLVLSADE